VILVDTSVWIDHFRARRGRNATLALPDLLDEDRVLMHPWVIGELALGGLGEKPEILADLDRLPVAPSLDPDELLELVTSRRLSGTGIGWVDAQLLGSAFVAGARLWTYDARLHALADGFGAAWLATAP
jgi:predicted nucleic acid-binding protein